MFNKPKKQGTGRELSGGDGGAWPAVIWAGLQRVRPQAEA